MTKRSGAVLGKTILGLAIVRGAIIVTAIAPNVFAAIGRLNKKHRSFFDKKEFNNSVKKLKYQKYIKIVKKDDKTFEIYLEKKGRQKALLEGFNNLTILKTKKWDEMWRIVIFDIPEKYKWARESFRCKLKLLNFYQIQESVFAFPYDCKKEIEFLCSVFNINDYVKFIEAKTIFYNNDLIDFYKLKS